MRCTFCNQKFYTDLVKLHSKSDLTIHKRCLKKIWAKAKSQMESNK